MVMPVEIIVIYCESSPCVNIFCIVQWYFYISCHSIRGGGGRGGGGYSSKRKRPLNLFTSLSHI